MVFSRTALHGLYILCYLDRNRDEPAMPSMRIATALGIPSQHSAKVLQRLCHAKLIESVRGRRGGYRLNRELSEIALLEVLDALNPSEEDKRLRPRSCRNYSGRMCDAHRGLTELHHRVRAGLAEVTLGGMKGSVCSDLPEESLVRVEEIGGVLNPAFSV